VPFRGSRALGPCGIEPILLSATCEVNDKTCKHHRQQSIFIYLPQGAGTM